MEASVEDLIEYYTKRHVGDCELTCVHDTDTVEALAELAKLREENATFEKRLESLRQSQWIQLEDVLAQNEKLREKNAVLMKRNAELADWVNSLGGYKTVPKSPEVG